MEPRYRRHARNAFVALLLVGVAAWLLPSFFSAEHYRHRLEAELKRVLHRPVTFGAVSFRLLPRPGFTMENAVVSEDPNFGSEPFAHVDRIDCALRWRSLWRSRLDFARLRLDHPTLNVVRNERGEWNFENLLLQMGIALPSLTTPAGIVSGLPALRQAHGSTLLTVPERSRREDGEQGRTAQAGSLELVAEDGRLSFQVGANKKPFAITELRAGLSFDPADHRIQFRLSGSPIRTDLSFPSPGVVELAGEWTPGKDLEGPLQATLRTRGALLYDWVPLLTGRNPELYGVLDVEVQLGGSLRVLELQGDARLTQLHRWELLPPSDPWPWSIHFRGQFDRRRGRALVESLEASFADSHLHLSGTVDEIPQSPEFDLVLALERSRLEDFLALGRRVWLNTGAWGVKGRVDGMLTIQGPWAQWRYGGFLGAQEVLLSTGAGDFPVSDLAVRIDERGARVAPLRVTLAPRVELVAEGILDRLSRPPRYELVLSARAVPLRAVLGFGRALSIPALRGLDAVGVATATVRLTGSAWPASRPTLTARAQLRAARLLVPGLTEPLNLPRVDLRVNGDEVVADPVVAVMGTSVFTARLVHPSADGKLPWEFDVRANNLSMEQGALWFDALGRRQPLPLLERLPGLSSFAARRAAASSLFSSLKARGRFATPRVTYRGLTLKDFSASLEISGRVIQVSQASFVAGEGRGQGDGKVDLTSAPALISADISLAEANVQALAGRLPAALRGSRGWISGSAHLESRGLSREEMSSNLRGVGTVLLKDASFGDFDPLGALARVADWGKLEPPRGPVGFHTAEVKLEVQDRRVAMRDVCLDFTGPRACEISVSGTYGFDGAVDLDVRMDLRNARRRWSRLAGRGEESDPDAQQVELRLAGPLDKLGVVPLSRLSRVNP
jgi:hypothetical protein